MGLPLEKLPDSRFGSHLRASADRPLLPICFREGAPCLADLNETHFDCVGELWPPGRVPSILWRNF